MNAFVSIARRSNKMYGLVRAQGLGRHISTSSHLGSKTNSSVSEKAAQSNAISKNIFGDIDSLLNTFRPQNQHQQERVLVTGGLGQIGKELIPALQSTYGVDNVVPSDIRPPAGMKLAREYTNFRQLDVLNFNEIQKLCQEEEILTIVHLAAILSANGEKSPQLTLKINNEGTQNVLEVARQEKNIKVFVPSTIAVYGTDSPKHLTPEDCIMRPSTMYGITKVHAELLGEYYNRVYGVDFRCLRFPGVVSTKQMPGGGTTDWAVEIFHQALQRSKYTCYLEKGTTLPFIYMPDLLHGTLQFLQTEESHLSRRVYNLGSFSCCPKELAHAIRRMLPDFDISYASDFRQDIADTWPMSIDASAASADWGWSPTYDLESMSRDVLNRFLNEQLEEDEGVDQEEIEDNFNTGS